MKPDIINTIRLEAEMCDPQVEVEDSKCMNQITWKRATNKHKLKNKHH